MYGVHFTLCLSFICPDGQIQAQQHYELVQERRGAAVGSLLQSSVLWREPAWSLQLGRTEQTHFSLRRRIDVDTGHLERGEGRGCRPAQRPLLLLKLLFTAVANRVDEVPVSLLTCSAV